MKYLYLLIPSLLLLQATVNAKETAELTVTGIRVNAFPGFDPGGAATLANSNSRLIAKAYFHYTSGGFVPYDSNTYKYGTNRGGFTDIQNPNNDELISFDESYTYLYNAQASAYQSRIRRTQVFDSYDKVVKLTYGGFTASATWKDTARYLYEYDAVTKKMNKSDYQIWYGGLWSDHGESYIVYDANNNIIALNSDSRNIDFVYDTKNNLLSMTDQVWDHLASKLVNSERKTYTYVANSSNMETYTLEKWDANSSAWTKNQNWIYKYGSADVDEAIEQAWNGSAWANTARNLYTYDAQNNRLTDTRQVWDAGSSTFVNATLTNYTYNSYNQATKIITTSWNAASSSWAHTAQDEEMHFYYEYYAPTGIDNITANGAELKLFPIPAATELNIVMNGATGTNAVAAIYDAKGSVVMQWAEPMTDTRYAKTVDMSALPTGNYILQVNCGMGNINKQFVIAR